MFPYIFFNAGYAGAGGAIASQALGGFNSWSSTATVDLETRMILVSRARQLFISSPVASAILDRFTSGIVGSGIKYQPQESTELLTDYKYSEMVDFLKKRFALASETNQLDAQKQQTFSMMQELACRNWLLSGDVFFIRKRDKEGKTSWRSIECDRVQTPYYCAVKDSFNNWECYNPSNGNRIIDGVELDDNAIPCAYWILKDYISQPWLVQEEQIERIPAFDDDGTPIVLHLFKRLRPDQYRGVPLIGNLIEALHSRKNYAQAEIQAAQLQAAVFGFVSSNNPTMDETEPLPSRELDRPIPVAPATKDTPPDTPTMQLDAKYKDQVDLEEWYNREFPSPKTVSAGQVVHLAENEDIKFLQSTHPHSNYSAFMDAIDRDLSAGVGLPHKVLTCDYDGSYSACRAAVREAGELFKNYRSYFIASFVKPIFEIFCQETLEGLVDDPLFVAKCLSIESQWKQPQPIVLDPKVELESYKLAIELGLIDRDEAALALFNHRAVREDPIEIKETVVDEV